MEPKVTYFLMSWVCLSIIINNIAMQTHPNAFVHMATTAASVMNMTNCWICSKLPSHSGSHFPFTAWPAPPTGIYEELVLDPAPFQSNSPPLLVTQMTQFPICFEISHNATTRGVFLGEGTHCNVTFVWNGTSMDAFLVTPKDFQDCVEWWETMTILFDKRPTLYGNWTLISPDGDQKHYPPPCLVKPLQAKGAIITPTYLISSHYPLAHMLHLLYCALLKKARATSGPYCEDNYQISSKTYSEIYWVCGQNAYKELPSRWWGTCGLAILTPAIRMMKQLPEGNIRLHRSLKNSMDILDTYVPLTRGQVAGSIAGCAVGMAMLGACSFGVATLGYAELRLQAVIEILANETADAIDRIAEEQGQIRKVALQNRMAMDIMMAANGGVCALVKDECCVWIDDYEMDDHERAEHIRKLAYVPPDTSMDWWDKFKGFFGDLGTKIVIWLIAAICILVLGCILIRLLISFIKGCVPSQSLMVSTALEDEMGPDSEEMTLKAMGNIEV